MEQVYIYAAPLPSKVKGVIVERLNDIIIFVNENLSDEEQKAAAEHELRHFREAHVWDIRGVGELEGESHAGL